MSDTKFEKLAGKLVDFFIETDPYEYMDSCEDVEAATKTLIDDLESGNTKLYVKSLVEYIDDEACNIQKATNLLNELAEL